MANLTGWERDVIKQIQSKDTTIARLQFSLAISMLLVVGLFITAYFLAMRIS